MVPPGENASIAVLFLAAYTVGAITPFVATGRANAASVCTVDTAGANDASNQKDLTKMCADYAGLPTSVTTTWNWDDLGTTGNNTMDACSLFDTDGDGYANYSVCTATNNTPATFTSVTVYSCSDTSSNRCYGSSAVAPSGTTCSVSQQNTDPFPAGSGYPFDTEGVCTIPLAAVGGANAVLIDVCSYPSSSPNSSPSDCVMYRDNSARIEVKKVLDPAVDPGLFNLKIGSTTYATNIGNNGTTEEQILTSGSITVSETAGTGTSLSSYTTSVVCRDANGTGAVVGQGNPTGASSRQLTINASDGSDIVCVFTNTRQTGTVTLIKSVTNDNGGTLGVNDFGLTVGGTGVTSGQAVPLPAGVPVAINEAGATGYSFVSITGAGCPAALGGTVTPINGQNITCTITNDDQPGTLVVNKLVTNDNGGTKQAQNFQFQVDGGTATSFETDGSNSVMVNAGSHTVTEVADNGYATTYDNCTNVTVPLGGTATCTITNNDKAATLILQKTVTNNNGGIKEASDFPVYIGSTLSTWGSHTVNAGSYDVHETPDPGYTPSLWGTDCSAAGSITLGLGETKTCTITNDDKPALLSGTKYEVNAAATDGAGASGLPNWTICLDANRNGACDAGESTTVTDAQGNYSFANLSVGTYGVLELGLGGSMDGWTQIFAPQPIALTIGQSSTGNDFGNFRNGSISGHKWNDANGDAQEANNEVHLSGWTIQLKNQAGTVVATDTTDVNGDYSFNTVAPGTYAVCEVQQNGWVQTYPTTNGGCHSVTIDVSGETNPDKNFGNQGRGTVEVKKVLSPAGDPGLFNLQINGTTRAANVGDGGTTGAISIAAGTYPVAELAGTGTSLSNYTSSWVCEAGQRGAGGSGTTTQVEVHPGDNWVCTFTNTRQTGTLTLKKHVVNNNGGTRSASDFTLHVKQGSNDVAGSPSAGSEDGTSYVLNTGSYTVSEDTPLAGYTQTSIVCNGQNTATVSVTPGQTTTCTITNDDIAPQIKVIKHVVNAGTNLTKTAADFTMNVTGATVSPATFSGSESGTMVTLNAGGYTVGETNDPAYTATYDGDCQSTIAVGDAIKTCTVTNTAVLRPAINVVKSGPATAHEGDTVTYTFTVTNPGNAPLSGLTVSDSVAGTGAVLQPGGDGNGNGKLDPGETWVYKLTYTIPSPQVANVDNTVTVCGTAANQVQPCDTDDHTLDVLHPSIGVEKSGPLYGYEGQIIGYTFVVTNTGDVALHNVGISDDIAVGESCEDTSLEPGAHTNCTAHYLIPLPTVDDVTNHVTASGTDTLGQTVTGTDDHTLDVIHPAINVVKSGPATAHEGDTVTYTFTVTNPGDISLGTVTVTDNVAGNAIYASGDANEDGMLDPGEMWIFTKNYVIPTGQVTDVVNTATACGYDPIQSETRGGHAACDTDTHTLDVLHPAINVVKSGPTTAYEGDTVTYTFTVTNPGDTPLTVDTVNDNVAGAATYQSGDANANGKLDTSETWIYTAQFTIPDQARDNITNTVTVCATDSLTTQKCDDDSHMTHVYHPTISVTKEVYTSAETDGGSFNLQIDGHTYATGGDGTTTHNIPVAPGAHTIGETEVEGTELSQYDSAVSCWLGDRLLGQTEGTRLEGVSATEDQQVECTIVNVHKAHLTVVKDATPNDPQVFDFTVDRLGVCDDAEREVLDRLKSREGEDCANTENVSEFGLQDSTDPVRARHSQWVSYGHYIVTEQSTDGWDLTNIDCGEGAEWYIDEDDGSLHIWLEPGAEASCTFSNTKRATVTVVKDAQPNAAQPFSFTTNLESDEEEKTTAFNLIDDGVNAMLSAATFTHVVPGTYTITENALAGWTLYGASCTGATATREGGVLTVKVTPGAEVRCTFVNQKNTVPQVLGAVTPPPAQKLENTGVNPLLGISMSLTVMGLAVLAALSTRRRSAHYTA
jgi:uncharacterized repeat protein (TIGR01451 family)